MAKTIPVTYSWHGRQFKGTFDVKRLCVRIGKNEYTPTLAAKSATDMRCGSINGWLAWRIAKRVRIGKHTFDSGTPISALRPALGVTVISKPRHNKAQSAENKRNTKPKGKNKRKNKK